MGDQPLQKRVSLGGHGDGQMDTAIAGRVSETAGATRRQPGYFLARSMREPKLSASPFNHVVISRESDGPRGQTRARRNLVGRRNHLPSTYGLLATRSPAGGESYASQL
jgi:hypothetical protein